MAFDPNDKETKAAIAKAVSDAVATATEEAVGGLKAKNTELLAKLKKAQKDSTIDPADHAALQAEFDELETNLSAANKALKAATAESDKNKSAHDTASRTIYELLVDNGLSNALLSAGVKNPAYQKAAKALLAKEKFDFEGEGAARVAKIGDKTLAEFVKTWATGDEGKAFVSAPANGGGGAPGGNGKLDGDALSKIENPNARLAAINEQADSAGK